MKLRIKLIVIIKKLIILLMIVTLFSCQHNSYEVGECIYLSHFMNIADSKDSLIMNDSIVKILINDNNSYKIIAFSIKKQKLYDELFSIENPDIKLNKKIECPSMVNSLAQTFDISKVDKLQIKQLKILIR